MMRELMHDAVAEARELVGGVMGDLRRENRLTDDELLRRYEQQHRGQPWAMVRFAQQQAPGGDVLEQALRYEQQMEELMKKRTGSAGGG